MPNVNFDVLPPADRAKIPLRVKMAVSSRPVETRQGQILKPGECALYSNPTNGTFGIFDGGIYGGVDKRVAADTARDSVDAELNDLPVGVKTGRAADTVYGVLVDAGKKLMAKGNSVSAAAGVGIISRDEASGQPVATIGYAGNVEFRLLRNGVLKQLNLPDTSVRDVKGTQDDRMALQKRLSDAETPAELTADEQWHFRAGDQVYTALGTSKLSPHVEHHRLRPGDRLLVINHGISHALTNREIQDILSKNPNPNEAIAALTEAAIKRSFGDGGSFRAGLADMAGIVVDVPADWAERTNQIPQHGINHAGRRPLAQQAVEPARRVEQPQRVKHFQQGALVRYTDGSLFVISGNKDSVGRLEMKPYGPDHDPTVHSRSLTEADLIAAGNDPTSRAERFGLARNLQDINTALDAFATGLEGSRQNPWTKEEVRAQIAGILAEDTLAKKVAILKTVTNADNFRINLGRVLNIPLTQK